ncbi:hypothetical protein B5X24_HaOG206431 [Helicoverpa armigera]|uniref:Uncharacterized protein n=1 Tax=Helicoverpa armigera TaxID=29058 RepID=A0A2W1BRN9_HELAM|nr:hypothetical protein B5X24_HaOG206431 [Helicoverpa armigera]
MGVSRRSVAMLIRWSVRTLMRGDGIASPVAVAYFHFLRAMLTWSDECKFDALFRALSAVEPTRSAKSYQEQHTRHITLVFLKRMDIWSIIFLKYVSLLLLPPYGTYFQS